MTTEWCGVPSPWEIDAPCEVYDDAVAHAAAREAEREAGPELEAAETDAELTGPRADVFDRAYARFEPSPYDLGITDDPEPVPYSLTPAAEAALDNAPDPGPYPGSGDPERLAQWCGFPSAAAMEAACTGGLIAPPL